MKWKIIADSGCDYRSLDNLAPNTEFVSVPLTIQVGDTIYTDDAQLNIDQMMEEMYATTTASKSACPSPDDYMKSFEGAENIVVVTIDVYKRQGLTSGVNHPLISQIIIGDDLIMHTTEELSIHLHLELA